MSPQGTESALNSEECFISTKRLIITSASAFFLGIVCGAFLISALNSWRGLSDPAVIIDVQNRGQDVVDVILKYHAENGRHPSDLKVLVPTYLTKRETRTGVRRNGNIGQTRMCSAWEFYAETTTTKGSITKINVGAMIVNVTTLRLYGLLSETQALNHHDLTGVFRIS